MKITHLIYSFITGGSEAMLADIASVQANKGKVSIIIINNNYDQTLLKRIDKRVDVYYINRIEGSKNPIPIIKLNFLLAKLHADVLHCHNHNIAPLLLPRFKKRTVLTLHCSGIPSNYLHQYHKLFAISDTVKNELAARTNLNSKVIYNGISINTILPRKEFKVINSFKIICVGRLDHRIKGQHLALEALHVLKQKGINNLRLDLIGTGNSEHFLKELTNKYGLNDQVTFLGLKDRDYIYTHLKDYDLLIQPSISEGFGLTVIEAMASKIPVLVSDVNGPMEIIQKGAFGYYFQSNNAKSLARQLEIIVEKNSPSILQELVESAYHHVMVNFNIVNTSNNYIENY